MARELRRRPEPALTRRLRSAARPAWSCSGATRCRRPRSRLRPRLRPRCRSLHSAAYRDRRPRSAIRTLIPRSIAAVSKLQPTLAASSNSTRPHRDPHVTMLILTIGTHGQFTRATTRHATPATLASHHPGRSQRIAATCMRLVSVSAPAARDRYFLPNMSPRPPATLPRSGMPPPASTPSRCAASGAGNLPFTNVNTVSTAVLACASEMPVLVADELDDLLHDSAS